MLFGRVEATAVPIDNSPRPEWLRVTVYLETGREVRVIREERLPVLKPIGGPDDSAWHADQYAQETIANELALEGWEVIGGGDVPPAEKGAVPRSATYAVRRMGTASNK